jgi:ABC-type glycerol-3-phosphate transport system substrate-binding protein
LQNMVKQPPTFKWGWGPVPYGNKNVQGVSGGWHWTMWRQGKHPEESAKVISWLAGDEFGMEAAKRFRIISPRKSIGAKLPELSVEPFTTCLDMIDNYGKVTRPHNTEYPNLMDVLGEALGNACIGGKPAKDELERAAEKMNKILASAAPCGV